MVNEKREYSNNNAWYWTNLKKYFCVNNATCFL